ncbi:MAG: PQQ-binding-like beta-propeller repeat protein [Myxococcota bacterium]
MATTGAFSGRTTTLIRGSRIRRSTTGAIVGFGDHVEARNWFSGSPLWTAPIGDPINNDLEPRTVGNPIVSHGRVFVCRAGVLYALDERRAALDRAVRR